MQRWLGNGIRPRPRAQPSWRPPWLIIIVRRPQCAYPQGNGEPLCQRLRGKKIGQAPRCISSFTILCLKVSQRCPRISRNNTDIWGFFGAFFCPFLGHIGLRDHHKIKNSRLCGSVAALLASHFQNKGRGSSRKAEACRESRGKDHLQSTGARMGCHKQPKNHNKMG